MACSPSVFKSRGALGHSRAPITLLGRDTVVVIVDPDREGAFAVLASPHLGSVLLADPRPKEQPPPLARSVVVETVVSGHVTKLLQDRACVRNASALPS